MIENDTPSAEGATNVALHQRDSAPPYQRLVVNIQGDANPGKAIGFDAEGRLATLEVDENPFAVVRTEAQFDAALAAGRSIVLDGTVALTTPKSIDTRWTTIKGPGCLSFTLDQALPAWQLRALTINADDVTLSNFELVSTEPVASNLCYGIAFTEGLQNVGHRTKLIDLLIHNWKRCVSKDGNTSAFTSPHEGVLIERLFAHTAREYVCCLNFGFTRLIMRDSRLLGWLDGATHVTTDNAMYGGSNWNDCSFDNCHFGNVGRMGFEATPASMVDYIHERTRLHWCRAENCGSMGFSLGFVDSGIFEKCLAKNVKQCGFEVAGSAPGDPQNPPGHPGLYAKAIIESCEVDGVSHNNPCYGISIDGAADTLVRGATKISNITTTLTDGACGVGLTSSIRSSVKLVDFTDCGHLFIYCTKGFLANTTGGHVFENNTFRNPGGTGSTHRSVYVDQQSASVRQNTTYQKAGTTLGYQCITSVPAQVFVDGVAVAYGDQTFGGSNIQLPG
jgi:hypothetical protein